MIVTSEQVKPQKIWIGVNMAMCWGTIIFALAACFGNVWLTYSDVPFGAVPYFNLTGQQTPADLGRIISSVRVGIAGYAIEDDVNSKGEKGFIAESTCGHGYEANFWIQEWVYFFTFAAATTSLINFIRMVLRVIKADPSGYVDEAAQAEADAKKKEEAEAAKAANADKPADNANNTDDDPKKEGEAEEEQPVMADLSKDERIKQTKGAILPLLVSPLLALIFIFTALMMWIGIQDDFLHCGKNTCDVMRDRVRGLNQLNITSVDPASPGCQMGFSFWLPIPAFLFAIGQVVTVLMFAKKAEEAINEAIGEPANAPTSA